LLTEEKHHYFKNSQLINSLWKNSPKSSNTQTQPEKIELTIKNPSIFNPNTAVVNQGKDPRGFIPEKEKYSLHPFTKQIAKSVAFQRVINEIIENAEKSSGPNLMSDYYLYRAVQQKNMEDITQILLQYSEGNPNNLITILQEAIQRLQIIQEKLPKLQTKKEKKKYQEITIPEQVNVFINTNVTEDKLAKFVPEGNFDKKNMAEFIRKVQKNFEDISTNEPNPTWQEMRPFLVAKARAWFLSQTETNKLKMKNDNTIQTKT